jgi:hypothetical protein
MLVLYGTKRLLFILLRASVCILPVRSLSRVLMHTGGALRLQPLMAAIWASIWRAWARRAAATVLTVSVSVASSIYCYLKNQISYLGRKAVLQLKQWLLFILLRACVSVIPVRSMSRVLTAMRGVVLSQAPMGTF